jgi:hypothetical protein
METKGSDGSEVVHYGSKMAENVNYLGWKSVWALSPTKLILTKQKDFV